MNMADDHYEDWLSQTDKPMPASESLEHTENLITLLEGYANSLRDDVRRGK